MKRDHALFVGRFQPLHRGHVRLILHILKHSSKFTIVIGSAQEKDTVHNPFSLSVRKRMIRECIRGNVQIVGVNDTKSNEVWLRNVLRAAKGATVVYHGPGKHYGLFRTTPLRVVKVKRWRGISGTMIRKKLNSGQDLSGLVPGEIRKRLPTLYKKMKQRRV